MVWSRPSCVCGILHFKLNSIDASERTSSSEPWNQMIGPTLFRFSWKAHVWSLPHTNKGKVGEKRSTFCTQMYADYLLKNTPTKHKKHIVNQKLEHFGDTNLKTRFDRIRVTFYKTRFVPSQDNASVSMLAILARVVFILLICLLALCGE